MSAHRKEGLRMEAAGCLLIILGIFFGDMWIKNLAEKRGADALEDGEGVPCGGDREAPADRDTAHPHMPCGADREAPAVGSPRRFLFRGHILVRRYHNKGAVLNLGQNKRRAVAAISVAMCIAAAVVFILSLGRRGNRLLRVGLALLLGGAFSNTYDRLKRKYVVDYFSFDVKWEPLRRVVFNISDFCIMIGALLAAVGA